MKIDFRKYLKESKKPLNEGQFSWFTQDTKQQIGSMPENTITVYMYDNKGNKWTEEDYEGYGVFGGKDYYELLAEMNGFEGADRDVGIDLIFGNKKIDKPILYPALVADSDYDWENHDFTKESKSDPNQSWVIEEDYEDEDYY